MELLTVLAGISSCVTGIGAALILLLRPVRELPLQGSLGTAFFAFVEQTFFKKLVTRRKISRTTRVRSKLKGCDLSWMTKKSFVSSGPEMKLPLPKPMQPTADGSGLWQTGFWGIWKTRRKA